MWSADLVSHPTCRHPASEQIPSGTCLVPLQTGGHNPLMNTVVPLCTLRACVRVPVQNLERDRRKPLGCVPVILSRCLGSALVLLCLDLASLIRATSWSWAGLISFTPREELVCGQTAHYGHDPAALQVTN